MTSLNLFTVPDLVAQVADILQLPFTVTNENILRPEKDVNKTQMIYFAILREVGLADKIINESSTAWNSGYRVHPELPSDVELHPEIFQVGTANCDACFTSHVVSYDN